jgi:cyanophycinase
MVLIGGEGFTPEFTPALRQLRELAGGDAARVVVLPTATAEDGEGVPEQRTRLALDYFDKIETLAEAAMVLDKAAADDPQMAQKVADATWIHVSGGKPVVLRSILENSAVWEAVLEAHRAGALLSGSSAGAIIFGEYGFSPRLPFPPRLEDLVFDPLPGFKLLPGIAVGPHFDAAPPEITSQLMGMLPPGATMVGIDEKTGLLGQDGTWEVVGAGRVTLIRGEAWTEYPSGTPVPLFD